MNKLNTQCQDQVVSFILQENILDEQTLQKLIEQQQANDESLISTLEKSELVNEKQLIRIILANGEEKIAFVNLSQELISPKAAHTVSYEIANQYNVIPIIKEGNNLLVAMSEPSNHIVKEQIAIRTGCNIVPVTASPVAIREAIRYHFNVRNISRQAIAAMRSKLKAGKNEMGDSNGHSTSPEDFK